VETVEKRFEDINLTIPRVQLQLPGIDVYAAMIPRVLIIIPAYNEEKTISGLLLDLRRIAPEFDRVVVNDGSRDETGKIVKDLGEKQLRLPCNVGYGRALQTGLKYALKQAYDILVCFDADGQHQPDDVPRMVNALIESNADMVIGSRYCDGSPYTGSFGRRLGQYLFSHLTRVLIGKRIYDTSSGFKALSAQACEAIIGGTFLDFHTEALVRLSMFGFQIRELPVTMQERNYGRSMHSLISFIDYPLKTLLLTVTAAIDAIIARRAR
jgi:glycosyltransferase involved in cell wall biosynthesis